MKNVDPKFREEISCIKYINKKGRSNSNIIFALLTLFFFITTSFQNVYSQNGKKIYQYAAKFICGESEGNGDVKGLYQSSVNIHNPEYFPVVIKYKVAVNLPHGKQGDISTFHDLELGPDGAVKFTCEDFRDIANASPQSTPFLTGFFVILSNRQLDVVTSISSSDSDGLALDLMEVTPKNISPPRLPDLIVSSFCVFDSRTAVATIKNIGGAPAPASVTRITLTPVNNGGIPTGPPVNVDLPIPALAPGASFGVSTPLPAGCFNPNCEVRAEADILNNVIESSEGNNKSPAPSACIG